MRKLLAPCLLVISLMTASAAQVEVSTLNSMNDTISKEIIDTELLFSMY